MNSTKIIDGSAIEIGSDNPYADLGYANADEIQVKAELACAITKVIKRRRLTQLRAAELPGAMWTYWGRLIRSMLPVAE